MFDTKCEFNLENAKKLSDSMGNRDRLLAGTFREWIAARATGSELPEQEEKPEGEKKKIFSRRPRSPKSG